MWTVAFAQARLRDVLSRRGSPFGILRILRSAAPCHTLPLLTKAQIDKLGERLRAGLPQEVDLSALDEYRRSFGPSYQEVTRVLKERLRAAPTGRTKSNLSILQKLRRETQPPFDTDARHRGLSNRSAGRVSSGCSRDEHSGPVRGNERHRSPPTPESRLQSSPCGRFNLRTARRSSSADRAPATVGRVVGEDGRHNERSDDQVWRRICSSPRTAGELFATRRENRGAGAGANWMQKWSTVQSPAVRRNRTGLMSSP